MGKTALVTGGAGFIGSHLVDRLVGEGYYVKVIDDLSTGQLANIEGHIEAGRVEFLKGDIRDPALVKKAMQDVDVVAHLAALTSVPFSMKNPDLVYDVNVTGSLNLIFAAIDQGVDRFVFASSCAVYGDTTVLPVKETAEFKPLSPYAESKLTNGALPKRHIQPGHAGFRYPALLQRIRPTTGTKRIQRRHNIVL